MINSDCGKRRVVIYARVSTDHKEQLSALENQLDWYEPILKARPEWELVDRYIDEGITGTSAEKRPQFMKMIRDAKQKKFDMIITREVSRFARNTVDTLQYTRDLKAKGVEVFFINDNIKTFDGDGELRLTIMATLAQAEIALIVMRPFSSYSLLYVLRVPQVAQNLYSPSLFAVNLPPSSSTTSLFWS